MSRVGGNGQWTRSEGAEVDDEGAIRAAVEAGGLTVAALGRPVEQAALLSGLADSNFLVAVLDVIARSLEHDGLEPEPEVAAAAMEAVLASTNPAVAADGLEVLLGSPALLSTIGSDLADALLEKAAPPDGGAAAREALLAADALEGATQLVLGGWIPTPWRLFAVLETVNPAHPPVYLRVGIRCVVTCVEHWPEAVGLADKLRQLVGLDPAAGETVPVDGSLESDVAVALARISILQALRAADPGEVVRHLNEVSTLLAAVHSLDDRVDAKVVTTIAALLRALAADEPIPGQQVERLHEAVREHEHFTAGTNHWFTDRTVAANAEWSRLAGDLRRAAEDLAQVSWYDPASVIARIVDLYRSTRTESIFRRADDGRAVRDLVAPALEAGFAEQMSLLHLLALHVKVLEDGAAEGSASEQERDDLPVAVELLNEARQAPGVLLPKPGAGAGGYHSGTSGQPADSLEEPRERIIRNVATQQLLDRATTGSVAGDTIRNRICEGFAASGDYKGMVREAVDHVAHLLISFLFSRDSLGPSEVPYLFDQESKEKDLAGDLEQFIKQSGQLGEVRTEVRHTAGGRVDLEFGYPGFNLYVELKVDSTAVPIGDRVSYLKQSATYQTQAPPLGFLMVLKILAPKTVPPLLVNCVDVIEMTDVSDQTRRIATFAVSGGRTTPSDQ